MHVLNLKGPRLLPCRPWMRLHRHLCVTPCYVQLLSRPLPPHLRLACNSEAHVLTSLSWLQATAWRTLAQRGRCSPRRPSTTPARTTSSSTSATNDEPAPHAAPASPLLSRAGAARLLALQTHDVRPNAKWGEIMASSLAATSLAGLVGPCMSAQQLSGPDASQLPLQGRLQACVPPSFGCERRDWSVAG